MGLLFLIKNTKAVGNIPNTLMTTNQKEILIVNSYVNTKEKNEVLCKSLAQLKKLNKQILLMSNSQIVSTAVLELCDFYIYNRENLLLPSNKSPFVWYANDVEIIYVYNEGVNLSIVRNMNIGLNFVKNMGFTKFLYMEYDNIFHDEDLPLIHQMFDVLSEKIAYFCRFNDYNKLAYETRIFSGDVDFFLANIPLPKTYEEWEMTYPYSTNTETLEYIFPILFNRYEDIIQFYNGGNGYLFNKSDIDIFRAGNDVNVIYNVNKVDTPLVFIIGTGAEYVVFIDDIQIDKVWLNRNDIKKYYFEISDRVTHVRVVRNGEVKTFEISINNIETFKSYGTRMDL